MADLDECIELLRPLGDRFNLLARLAERVDYGGRPGDAEELLALADDVERGLHQSGDDAPATYRELSTVYLRAWQRSDYSDDALRERALDAARRGLGPAGSDPGAMAWSQYGVTCDMVAKRTGDPKDLKATVRAFENALSAAERAEQMTGGHQVFGGAPQLAGARVQLARALVHRGAPEMPPAPTSCWPAYPSCSPHTTRSPPVRPRTSGRSWKLTEAAGNTPAARTSCRWPPTRK